MAAARLALLLIGLGVSPPGFAQQEGGTSGRAVIHRVAPVYPPTAHTFHLKGVVKLDVSVASDGSVKSAKIVGGNPLLAEEARKAVAQWKWQPFPRTTKEAVEIKFEAD